MPTIVKRNRRNLALVRIPGLRFEFWRKDQRFTIHESLYVCIHVYVLTTCLYCSAT